ncbi:MAG: CPBP family intramembrane metalloprotease [Armatimonadetes bacterium]|nr:CPBP family intramembrane metalloprotease [Armatimonadota bacterium]
MPFARRIFLILITFFWLVILLSKYFIPNKIEQNFFLHSFDITKYLLRAYLLDEKSGQRFLEKSIEIYEENLKQNLKDYKLYLKLAILYDKDKNYLSSASYFDKSFEISQDNFIKELKNLYLKKTPPKDLISFEKKLKFYLNDFYLNQSLIYLYNYAYSPLKAQNFLRQIKKEALFFIFKLIFLTSMLALIFLSGLFFLIYFLFGNLNSKKVGILNYPSMALNQVWLIFILWDMIHLAAGLFLYKLFHFKIFSIILIYFSLNCLILSLIYFNLKGARETGLKYKFKQLGLIFNFKNILLGIQGYCMAIPLIFLTALINQLILKSYSISSNPIFEFLRYSWSSLEEFLLFFLISFLGPFFEEIIFRGFLYTNLRKVLGFKTSLLLTAFIFSLIHGDLGATLPIFMLGAILTYLYEYSGSIVPGMVLHSLWNTGTYFVFTILFKQG